MSPWPGLEIIIIIMGPIHPSIFCTCLFLCSIKGMHMKDEDCIYTGMLPCSLQRHPKTTAHTRDISVNKLPIKTVLRLGGSQINQRNPHAWARNTRKLHKKKTQPGNKPQLHPILSLPVWTHTKLFELDQSLDQTRNRQISGLVKYDSSSELWCGPNKWTLVWFTIEGMYVDNLNNNRIKGNERQTLTWAVYCWKKRKKESAEWTVTEVQVKKKQILRVWYKKWWSLCTNYSGWFE